MSSNEPTGANPPMADEDLELLLVDETGDANDSQEGVGANPGAAEAGGDNDDDIMLVEEQDTIFTDEFRESFEEDKANADKFFAPDSAQNVANLSPEVRAATAKYAAALFEWFCCMSSPDLLHPDLPNFADIDLPFPITPDRQRVLIKREFGVRLADVWRQTKSPEKMAAQYKMHIGIAVMSLLDYGFSNRSFEMDVYPLLQCLMIDKVDYHVIASFVLKNCEPRDWKDPEDFILETLVPPIIGCIGLYMISTDCIRGKAAEIPWETMVRNIDDIPPTDLEKFDAVLLEAHKEMRANDPLTKELEAKMKIVSQLEANAAMITREEKKVREQMKIDQQEIIELSAKYAAMNQEKKRHIQHILPANFEQHGAELAHADDEINILEVRANPNFDKIYITKPDLELVKGAAILARRKLNAPEKFEPAIYMEKDETDPVNRGIICFDSEPDKPVSVPLLSIALGASMKGRMPTMSEGLRVAARARHPLHPTGPHGIYSGTIISKYGVSKQDYVVIFDDFFDEYAHIDELWLMVSQPFTESEAFDSRIAYTLMTPSEAAPTFSEERKAFILSFFSKYPDWSLVKMADRIGSNMSCFHREGMGWVAKVLAVDRHMVWLRFSTNTPGSEQSCMAFPCTKHNHLDEKMYRGNPRLKSARTQTNFDKALETYRRGETDEDTRRTLHLSIVKDLNMNPKSRQQLRRQQQIADRFEAAVPVAAKKRGEGGTQFSQTARKCGTGLQVESAVPGSETVRKRREAEVVILHHETEQRAYASDLHHEVCSHECLKGLDKDPFHDDFKRDHISPFYIPITCGWRRVKEKYPCRRRDLQRNSATLVLYRAPCGKPLYSIEEIIGYLKLTRSELTMDNFSFSPDIDETAYVHIKPESIVAVDLTCGQEARPIPVTNEMDKVAYHEAFKYRGRRYPLNSDVSMQTMNKDFCSGCDCTDDCSDWTKCACQRLTHRESVRATHTFPTVTKGYTNRRLAEKVPTAIYECNENCGCSRKRCTNRVVQNEISVPMMMYKTDGMGWGVRAICDIPKGTFISCYHGALMSDQIGEVNGEGDEYYADLDFYDLAENEKQNSGVDLTVDHGIFVDDVGTRELSADEVRDAQPDDELEVFRKEFEKMMKKANKALQKQQPKKRGRPKKMEMKEAVRATASNESMDTEDEEEELRVEKGGSESADEGMEVDVQPAGRGEDEEIDEGVEEGDCSSQDEEEAASKSTSPEDEKKQEEEEQGRLRSCRRRMEAEKADKRMEELRKREMKAAEERAAAATRYLIPFTDESGTSQLDVYFGNAECDSLFLIDAKSAGNIGRQYNHSCEPNMFTNHIFVDTHDIRLPWVAFFAKRPIKAGEELTWDYGWAPNPTERRGIKCLCNAPNCRIDLL